MSPTGPLYKGLSRQNLIQVFSLVKLSGLNILLDVHQCSLKGP
jgi:hypothetical protein